MKVENAVVGGSVIFAIVVWILIIVGCIGWCLNVYKLTQCDFAAPYRAEAVRGIGIVVAPVGSIAGYCEIKDDE